jgi:Holliday junction resolvasome RuvABC endonuclease subunit
VNLLSVDPGTKATGYALWDGARLMKVDTLHALHYLAPERILVQLEGIGRLIKRYGVEEVAFEQAKHRYNAALKDMVIALRRYVRTEHKLPAYGYNPWEVKRALAVGGKTPRSKEEVLFGVELWLRSDHGAGSELALVEAADDNGVDAVAVGIAHLEVYKLASLIMASNRRLKFAAARKLALDAARTTRKRSRR